MRSLSEAQIWVGAISDCGTAYLLLVAPSETRVEQIFDLRGSLPEARQ